MPYIIHNVWHNIVNTVVSGDIAVCYILNYLVFYLLIDVFAVRPVFTMNLSLGIAYLIPIPVLFW